jgi:hypothetical protein
MREIKLDPALGDITSYLWSVHPLPWSINHGQIHRSYIMVDGTICVEFELDKHSVENTERWSVRKNGIVLEVCDRDNIPVMENWIFFDKKTKINATLCLRAKK